MTKILKGELEIDSERGVIYFHASKGNIPTVLRICRLPKPIPTNQFLDITTGVGCNWKGKEHDTKS